MNKIFVLITHGKFASGIKTSVEMIVGKQDNLLCIDCYLDKDFDIKKEVDKVLMNTDKEIIFLTDIFGGSVNNYISTLTNRENIYLLTGFNLSLILNLLENQDLETHKMIDISIEEAKKQIKKFESIKLEDEDF